MKTRVVGAELFHVDVQTDRQIEKRKVIVGFRNFANRLRINATDVAFNFKTFVRDLNKLINICDN
jgi:hypothetical protein